ncbi:hypothetical protein GGS21DRAFT_418070 [Xylaria nigripes]|nr:hypothetical protein GGS21DRAFT_418070 [Xylaria nigripes]
MALKRTADSEIELKLSKNKRHRVGRTDLASSQRGAFGDLGNATTAPTGDSDLDCEDDSEALTYLRSVRIQASTIPHVLAAKKAGPSLPPHATSLPGRSEERIEDEDGEEGDIERTIYEDGVGDFRGYYEDGAYVAYPEDYWKEGDEDDELYDEDYEEGEQIDTELEDANESDASKSAESRPHNSSAEEIKDAYFASIMERFLAFRKILQTTPPSDVIRALPATNPTEVEEWTRGAATFQQWGARLRGTDPLPAQIAAMHKDGVFRLLRVILASHFLRKKTKIHERTSRWIWALLARLPDHGELDYMEVGCIRELGKRAVLLMVSLAELELLREHFEVAGSSPEDQDEYEVGVDVDEYYEDDYSQDDDRIDAADTPIPEITSTYITEPVTNDNANQLSPDFDEAHHEASNEPSHKQGSDKASDIEMQLSSDLEDGEVADVPPSSPHSDPIAHIEMAKARLLTQLNNHALDEGEVDDYEGPTSATPLAQLAYPAPSDIASKPTAASTVEQEQDMGQSERGTDDERNEYLDRAKVNERATLNMILTVAGEFYGQRDLLEFRDPFGGLQFE